jgi:nucleotide-binding universal stress UspA family protein
MIKRLLVPLDGSSLAESVLPVAASLAKKINISVTLIHVIEKEAPEKIHGQSHLQMPKDAVNYLNTIAGLEIFNGVSMEMHVHEEGIKNVSQSIADHSKELNQDIVLMCSHGNSGLLGILYGSIAQQVISLGHIPVLLIHPVKDYVNAKYSFENFLVPLDGNTDHETALNYALDFAKLCEAKINLLTAIPYSGNMTGKQTPVNRLLPSATSIMMDMIVTDTEEYLKKIKEKLEQSSLTVTTKISRNDPESAIIEEANNINADLIIIGTHGKKGADAFWEGSITPKISKSTTIPLLLIPVNK